MFLKEKTGKKKIVHAGYAKRTLENWATFSFQWAITLCHIFFLFVPQLNKKVQRSTIHRKLF